MNANKPTPEQVARWAVGMGAKPEIVAAQFLEGADAMREIARKARASRSGKFRGMTAEKAELLAAELDARAKQVPELMRRAVAVVGRVGGGA